MRISKLKSSASRSCRSCAMTKHNMSKTSTYQSWQRMKERCRNSKTNDYKYYGGRGIKIDDRWLKFENFYADMGEKKEGLELDRINNDGDYTPNNCRWVTHKENMNNTRHSKKGVQ